MRIMLPMLNAAGSSPSSAVTTSPHRLRPLRSSRRTNPFPLTWMWPKNTDVSWRDDAHPPPQFEAADTYVPAQRLERLFSAIVSRNNAMPAIRRVVRESRVFPMSSRTRIPRRRAPKREVQENEEHRPFMSTLSIRLVNRSEG